MQLLLAYLFAVLGLCVGTACALAIWKLWQRCDHLEAAVKRHVLALQQAQTQVQIATSGAVGMGKRLMALETRMQQVVEAQEQVGGPADHYAYTQAKHMLDQGADVQTVVNNCGLSSSEAQLMALVRQQLGPAAGGRK